MRITLTTLSPLLVSSGESSAHIDADVKYDRYGLPFISGKTFKGLLRESCVEVCEILRTENPHEVVNYLFGVPGGAQNGILKFSNFRIKNYENVAFQLLSHKEITPKFIQNHFTLIRKQTTLNDDGIAKDKSLRTYRLIKTDTEFEGAIEKKGNRFDEELAKALLNLRYVGTRRNRGFGKVALQSAQDDVPVTQGSKTPVHGTSGDNCKLSFKITLKSPLQISKQIGDQNIASTEDFIPAQIIRGLVASLLIDTGSCSKPAHKDVTFRKLILGYSDSVLPVKYANAFVSVIDEQYKPVPRALGYKKTEYPEERKAYNLLAARHLAKPLNGWYISNGTSFKQNEVNTLFSFHSSRKNERIAGRSTKKNGAIFYYESIEENQTFTALISGDGDSLTKIQELLHQNDGHHRIGRSKTAAYSMVLCSDFKIINYPKEKAGKKIEKGEQFYIVFQSPVIVYNEFGTAIPDKKYLDEALKTHQIRLDKIASSNSFVEGYMGVWKSKTNRENAFATGTTLLATALDEVDAFKLERAGVGERRNEGYGNIEITDIPLEYEIIIYNKSSNILACKNNEGTVFADIKTAFEQQEMENRLRKNAIEESSRHELKNSLIYRLREELRQSSSLTKWQGFLDTIKEKKAGDNITDNHLWANLYQLKGAAGWDNQKLYWETFFNALRVKSKK